ncbi:rhodanese-like domain-containing protein [Candidatus Gracilibacteria bacterium]|nr:rhodanese-like domain-containing protein [Candidatus Gracilibacteria bacterium]
MYTEISSRDLEILIYDHADVELIDVREKKEWDQIRIPGAKLIPLSSIEFHIGDIDFSKPVYIFCRSGSRSARVCQWLEGEGKAAINVAGSIAALYRDQSDIIEITEVFNPSYFN